MAAVAITSETEVDRAWNEICRLGLQTYVADLDARGYTVIPPEIATPNGLAERMLEAVLDIAERRNGERPDLETGSTHAHLGIETTSTRRAERTTQRPLADRPRPLATRATPPSAI